MRDHPILFSAAMIRAILDGRKTQTRRAVVDSNVRGSHRVADFELAAAWVDRGPSPAGNPGPYLKAPIAHGDMVGEGVVERLYPRWLPGDRLWVRESWQYADWTEEGEPYVRYAADGAVRFCGGAGEDEALVDVWADLSRRENYDIDGKAADRRWRPSIHMPRWASRLTLKVVAVRPERLQALSVADARAEGFAATPSLPIDPRDWFRGVWDTINAGRGCAWETNPWVWVVEFASVQDGASRVISRAV